MPKNEADRTEAFLLARKNSMKTVKCNLYKFFGNCKGHSALSKAAWAIAAGNPRFADYLYGEKMGTAESFQVLDQIEKDAEEAARLINWIRLPYHSDGDFHNCLRNQTENRVIEYVKNELLLLHARIGTLENNDSKACSELLYYYSGKYDAYRTILSLLSKKD